MWNSRSNSKNSTCNFISFFYIILCFFYLELVRKWMVYSLHTNVIYYIVLCDLSNQIIHVHKQFKCTRHPNQLHSSSRSSFFQWQTTWNHIYCMKCNICKSLCSRWKLIEVSNASSAISLGYFLPKKIQMDFCLPHSIGFKFLMISQRIFRPHLQNKIVYQQNAIDQCHLRQRAASKD